VLIGCKIFHLFETIIGLENTKTLKSHIDYYEKILDMIDQPAENCIFIGNSLAEIELPKKLGMKTVHITRENDKQAIAASENTAELILPDLTDLISKIFS
jgi:FMN phosphatase YigB (HAD superfamily)